MRATLNKKGGFAFPSAKSLLVVMAGSGALLLGLLALAMPQIALEASLRGLSIWWDILFPALFPFFVLSDVLLGFGIVHLVGTLLDPFMRPLFRIPGVGGFVVAMGFASGYPVGAKMTSRLMEQKLLGREEGERLVAMTTSSDPIFLIGAVSIGFFGRVDIAPVLAAAHYGGAMLVGLAMRNAGRRKNAPPQKQSEQLQDGNRLKRALLAMHEARIADGRPFGVLLNQSLQSSLSLMIVVGGLVVFFSATLQLLIHSGLLDLMRHLFALVNQAFGRSPGLADAYVQGTFEVTLGSRAAAVPLDATLPPLIDRVAAAAFVLSWAGLSVHAQVAGLMSRTDWRYGPFLRARLLHGVLAVLLVYILWPLIFRGVS